MIFDPLNKDKIHITEDVKTVILDETSSTNDEIRNNYFNEEKVLIVANRQIAGKGRTGKKFFSPPNTGIYMSLKIKPDFDCELVGFVTPLVAVEVLKAIKTVLGIEVKIKWVNDLYYNSKKVCGILTETVGDILKSNKPECLIIGIGINVYPPENGFEEDIQSKAGYLTETICPNTRNKLISEITNNICNGIKKISEKYFFYDYRKNSMLIGKKVKYNNQNVEVIDISDDCGLIIKMSDGQIKTIHSGQIII